ncbi:hypothetical protein [Nocardioides zhouii]|uniref:Uncharacterized protein n=1 Tax=Nocardioides zhouii TaxID=1168729 RepID=A0A4V1RPU2_9ACTN|nr:hypothetical protein [Nocardioides zhouii]RYC10547.1 hypothetical protein EUA94_12170 [Nocardioides zhouii]
MHDEGEPLAAIALALGRTQRDARWLLAAAELLGTDVSPTKMIVRAAVEAGDCSALVATLSTLTYTATECAPYPTEGARRGTWDEVRFAYIHGYLSAEEFNAVRRAAAPPDA